MPKLLLPLILLLFPAFAFAESGTVANTGTVVPSLPVSCESVYRIVGPSQIKADAVHEYSLATGSGADISGSITYTLKRDGKIVETVHSKDVYSRAFGTPGELVLEAKASNGVTCEGSVKKNIRVYRSVLTYVGSELSGLKTGMADILEKNDILLKSSTAKSILAGSEESQELWDSIEQSDTLVVGSQDVLGFFSDMAKLQKIRQVNFSKKKIYVISGFSRSFLSKVLASPLSQIGATKAFLISEDQFYSLIARLSTGEKSDMNIGEELSYVKSGRVYSLGGFVEFLAYAGFSYQLLASLLMITFVVLVLNFLKQVVGFNVFGIYYPVLLALAIASIGRSGAFIFLFIGLVSIAAVNLFSKKVHLLLHAKRALLISLYIVLFLFFLGIDNFFELSFINYSIFDNSLVIFPLFITVILADKIFQEDISVFGKMGMLDMLQYAIVTLVIYALFEYKALQYFLISYPDIIILVVFLNILVGRYMGLQAFEYFRFSPLLKKLNEEEE